MTDQTQDTINQAQITVTYYFGPGDSPPWHISPLGIGVLPMPMAVLGVVHLELPIFMIGLTWLALGVIILRRADLSAGM